MEIKTVWEPIEFSEKFDGKVNGLLADGWKLARREVLEPYPYVAYAELVKLDEADMETLEAEPVTWQEAAQVLRDECMDAAGCDNRCPMHDWCQRNNPDGPPPSEWSDPAFSDLE